MFGNQKNYKDINSEEREEYNTEILEKILEISEENNDILHSLKRSEKRANIFRFIYWSLIIFAVFGLFIYLKPIIDFIFQNMEPIKNLFYKIPEITNQFPETNNLKNILNQFKQE